MRFNQVLHPELLFDLRGPVAEREALKMLLADVDFSKEGWTYFNARTKIGTTYKLEQCASNEVKRGPHPGGTYFPNHFSYGPKVGNLDPNLQGFLALCKKFKVESPRSYFVGRDFAKALGEIDRAIPMQFLPDRFFGFFGFPPETLWDGHKFIQSVYVFIGDASESTLKDENFGKKLMWLQYVDVDGGIGSARFILENKKITEIAAGQRTIDVLYDKSVTDSLNQHRSKVDVTVINAVLYLHSQDAELISLVGTAADRFSNRQRIETRKKQAAKGLENHCTIPVTFLNYGFQSRVYKDAEVKVRGHHRWQPHGSGRSQVKLIWIDEHARHYGEG